MYRLVYHSGNITQNENEYFKGNLSIFEMTFTKSNKNVRLKMLKDNHRIWNENLTRICKCWTKPWDRWWKLQSWNLLIQIMTELNCSLRILNQNLGHLVKNLIFWMKIYQNFEQKKKKLFGTVDWKSENTNKNT